MIETFPAAAWTIWHGPRGGRTRGASSQDALDSLVLEGAPARRLSQDDRDAIAAALTARQYEERKTRRFGRIIVPAGPLS